MEWLERLNDALDYIESNLDGEIDYAIAAKLACCSVYHFQRMFSYIAGRPLAEYIRNRKLTKAAIDLQNGDKVIDVAIRYGYESPTAFNRAFQKLHNVTPSNAQKEGTLLKSYSPISFKITIKGVEEMNYSIVNKDEFRVVGVKITIKNNIKENFEDVPKFWNETSKSGRINDVIALMDESSNGILGLCLAMDSLENWDYYIATATNRDVPEGMHEYIVPACAWAIFPGEGVMPTAIQEIEKKAFTEWLPTSGYEYADAPDIEVYLNADPSNSKFEAWIPIRKK